MAIRFLCQRCGKLLGIASRKAGAEIECPKCGYAQTVPTEEAAAAALAMTQSTTVAKDLVEEASGVVVYDDQPAAIETPRPRQHSQEASTPKADEAEAGEPVPQGMILFRRRTLYVQAVLFLVVGVGAFGAGYLMGRGDATFEELVRRDQAVNQPVLIEGTLTFLPDLNRRQGDEGAVVVALPEDAKPNKKLSARDLRPRRGQLDPSPATLDQIAELGGAYARADTSGSFTMEVPRPGSYRLLLISCSTSRPPREPLDELDSDEINRFFTSAAELLGNHKFRCSLEQIDADFAPIEHDFGTSGRP